MMSIKAIFLDRDGTIIVDKNYSSNPDSIEFKKNAIVGLKNLQKHFELFIVTNQSGVGRGLFSKKDFFKFNKEFLKRCEDEGVFFKNVFYCFHKPSDNCNCRKPKIGMIPKKLTLNNSFMIGDKESDIEFGKALGIKTISVNPSVNADFIAKDLLEATKFIKDDKLL